MHTALAILLKSKKPLPVPVIAQAIAKIVMRAKTILTTFRMTPFFMQSRSFIKFRFISRINQLAKLIDFRQVICFINLRLTVSVPAAACQKHTLIMKANVVHNGELIVGYSLFKGPEEIVSRGHQQRGILDRIFFIPPQRRVRIFLRNAVEALYKCFQLGRDRPEQQWRGKDQCSLPL